KGLWPGPARCTAHPPRLGVGLEWVSADAYRHGDRGRAFLPYRIDRVGFHRRPGQVVWSHVRVTRNDEQFLCSDTLVFDETGEVVAEVIGLTSKRLAGGAHARPTGSTRAAASTAGRARPRSGPSTRAA